MLKSNELRIGNQIFFRSSEPDSIPDTVITVNIRLLQHFCRLEKFKKASILKSFYPPIPLTPEILGKCGFEKGLLWHFFNINQSLRLYSDFDNTTCYLFDLQDNCLAKCEYLHQLQNLYFSLTGEELKYNEK